MSSNGKQPSNRSDGAQHQATILPLDRFNAFSDGVFAIAITILVLELPVPSLSDGLRSAVEDIRPDLLGYFMSFLYIGGFWTSHARVTGRMKRGDSVAYGINLLLLLIVALLPFTTKLLVTNLGGPAVSLAAIVYGINVVVASFVLSLLMIHVAHKSELLEDEIDDNVLREIYRRRWLALGLGVFAVILAFVAPSASVMLYFVVALLFLMLPLLSMVRARHHAAR